MDFLFNILYIILFVLCLSILIIVHELGHLAVAKAFKVYCLEFSIGYGPKLFSFKRKKAETKFSIRSIPFGGYVSMVGEGTEMPDGVTIDDSRSFSKIKKWKRVIILMAGVTMNAVLALLVFFISETCFIQTDIYASQLVVSESSIAASAGLASEDKIYLDSETFGENASVYVVDKLTAYYTYQDEGSIEPREEPVIVALSRSTSSIKDLSWSDHLVYLEPAAIGGSKTLSEYQIPIATNVVSVTFNITKYVDIPETEEIETAPVSITLQARTKNDSPDRYFDSIGLSFYSHQYWNNFNKANRNTWQLMGNSSIAIFRGLGALFTSPDSVGGIIAVGYVSTSTLRNFGLVSFLQLWGVISINLAIINLLPFPGLDGWQILVLIIESIIKKEISQKVKNIVSTVGMLLLFGLMFILLIKDLLFYVI